MWMHRESDSPKQAPRGLCILDDDVQVGAGDGDVGVPCRGADLGQRPAAGQRVADERVAAEVASSVLLSVCQCANRSFSDRT
jgi:hypothetical protein